MNKLNEFNIVAIEKSLWRGAEINIIRERENEDCDNIQDLSIKYKVVELYVSINTDLTKESLIKYVIAKINQNKYEYDALSNSHYTMEHHQYVLKALAIKEREKRKEIIKSHTKIKYELNYYEYWNKEVEVDNGGRAFSDMYNLCMLDYVGSYERELLVI